MDSSRTPSSGLAGQGLTLVTGVGGRPLARREVDSWYRGTHPAETADVTASHSRSPQRPATV